MDLNLGFGADSLSEFNDGFVNFFIQKENSIPSSDQMYASKTSFDRVKDKLILLGSDTRLDDKEPYYFLYALNEVGYIFAQVVNTNVHSEYFDHYYLHIFYAKPQEALLNDFVKQLDSRKRRPARPVVDSTYTIGLLTPSINGLVVKFYNLWFNDVPLTNYSQNVSDSFDSVVESLTTSTKGLYLFTGDPGTGKTNFLRKLSHACKPVNKRFIFINADNAELLGDPNLIATLLEHRNSVLVIEDGESSIASRKASKEERSKFTSNLLNITDGLMSDILQMQVIVTLNFAEENIDPAFLRAGRLKQKLHFGKLTVDQSNEWLKRNGVTDTVTEEQQLCNLYAMLPVKK